ncbi:hypothetical protein OUZ56_023606 [Daphnia magna]|uniref:CCHC-type domain-containing protein n=1 Tax=Daphnia magna TaxID=35525 RepID=A0ABR0AZB8_9CRUS|nr:hypothetical protein OUZ56_023606 [Daphnia magna]
MELKREFLAWEREALRGFAIRSRVQSTAEEETSTFHMNKSTSNFQKSLITQLKTNDNCKITQSEQINLEIIKHFSGIFQNQPAPNTHLAGKFIEGIRGALNRTKPTKNDPGLSVVAQSLNAQAFKRSSVPRRIPQNLDLGIVQTRLKEFGNVIEARWERYRVAEDEVLYPVLATWMIVRMTVTKNIPSYITIGSYRAMVKYEGQKPTCRLCDEETHFSYDCPTLKRNQEPTIVQKPVAKKTKKTETIKQTTVVIPVVANSMVSQVPLESESQDSLSESTNNLETESMECDTATTSASVPPKDIPLKPISKSKIAAPDTETEDQETTSNNIT